MKLTVGETSDKAAILNVKGTDEVITIACANAPDVAAKIVRAVNFHPALIAGLTPFRSSEMGGLLINMIDTREPGGDVALERLTKMISIIDVILDAAEEHEEDMVE
jgi:hypothetical protein